MKHTLLFILLFSMISLISCSNDQSTESQSTTLSGTVVDKETQQPVTGATITIAELQTTSDAGGHYEFSNAPEGEQVLAAVKNGYASYQTGVPVTSGDNVADIELETMSAYCASHSTITYKGKEYNTVLVGSQCWFKENLNYGTQIDKNQESANNPTVEKYCMRNSTSFCDTYGGLYKWDEAMNYIYEEGGQGICPESWHIPTFPEIENLKIAVGEDGNALKEIGEGEGEGTGTNTSGFSALLGGYLISYADDDPFFENIYNWTLFWTSTTSGFEDAFVGDLNRSSSNFTLGQRNRNWGVSIRCLKD